MADRIDAIRARLAAATPGPWEADASCSCHDCWGDDTGRLPGRPAECPNAQIMGIDGVVTEVGYGSISVTAADAYLIANAPADLAYLLDEVQRLRAQLDAGDPDERDTRYDNLATTAADTVQDYAHKCCDHVDTCTCSMGRLARALGITEDDL